MLLEKWEIGLRRCVASRWSELKISVARNRKTIAFVTISIRISVWLKSIFSLSLALLLLLLLVGVVVVLLLLLLLAGCLYCLCSRSGSWLRMPRLSLIFFSLHFISHFYFENYTHNTQPEQPNRGQNLQSFSNLKRHVAVSTLYTFLCDII